MSGVRVVCECWVSVFLLGFCGAAILFLQNFNTYFRYFSLRIISFGIQNIPFRLKAKQAKLIFFSRYFASLIFASVSLQSEMRGHPTSNTKVSHLTVSILKESLFVLKDLNCIELLNKE